MGDIRRYFAKLQKIYNDLDDICLELKDDGIEVDIRNFPNFDILP